MKILFKPKKIWYNYKKSPKRCNLFPSLTVYMGEDLLQR